MAATRGRGLQEIFGPPAAACRPMSRMKYASPRGARQPAPPLRRRAGADRGRRGRSKPAEEDQIDHDSRKGQDRGVLRPRRAGLNECRRAQAESSWEQRLLQNAACDGPVKPEYQELKFTLHRKLLERINLDALAGIDDDGIHDEVRQAVLAMVEDEPNLLTAAEKQQISDEVLHEVFGLGPLEPLLQDSTISRHPGQRPRAGVRGAQAGCSN